MQFELSAKTLFSVPELKPTVAQWLLEEWPGWYGPGCPGDLSADMESFAASESSLPIGFVIFDGATPVGFGALKAESIPSQRHLTPWASAAYVIPDLRRKGIGGFLLNTIDLHAKSLGYANTYCGTSTASTLLIRCGWVRVERILHAGKPLDVFLSKA